MGVIYVHSSYCSSRRSQSIVTNTTTTSGNETDSARSRTKGKTKYVQILVLVAELIGAALIQTTPIIAVR